MSGMNLSIYVGPYLCCQNKLMEAPQKKRVCTSPGCRSLNRARRDHLAFCSACGSPLQFVLVPSARRLVDALMLYDKSEVLSWVLVTREHVDLFIPNQWPGAVPESLKTRDLDTEGASVITAEAHQTEIAWFRGVFAEAIEQANQAYGDAYVEVRWGTVSYPD